MATVSVFCFFAVYVVSFLSVSGYGQNTWPLKLSNPLIVFQEYLTPSAFQHWASINAIPCHYWIIDWFMSLFFTFQTCVQSDFTMVRLGPRIKRKFLTVIDPTVSCTLEVCPPFCATTTVQTYSFAPLIYAWKKQISNERSSKIYYIGGLNLQLPSTDLHLEFGTGAYPVFHKFWFFSFISCYPNSGADMSPFILKREEAKQWVFFHNWTENNYWKISGNSFCLLLFCRLRCFFFKRFWLWTKQVALEALKSIDCFSRVFLHSV